MFLYRILLKLHIFTASAKIQASLSISIANNNSTFLFLCIFTLCIVCRETRLVDTRIFHFNSPGLVMHQYKVCLIFKFPSPGCRLVLALVFQVHLLTLEYNLRTDAEINFRGHISHMHRLCKFTASGRISNGKSYLIITRLTIGGNRMTGICGFFLGPRHTPSILTAVSSLGFIDQTHRGTGRNTLRAKSEQRLR